MAKNSTNNKTKTTTTKKSTITSTNKTVKKRKKSTKKPQKTLKGTRLNIPVIHKKIVLTRQDFTLIVIIFLIAILLIVSTYAWLSTALNVKIRKFSMVVTRNSGLTISLDGIDFDSYIEISEGVLINELKNTYPDNTSQWSALGLTPVSTNGISSPNNPTFDVYASSGVRYRGKKKENGFVTTTLMDERGRTAYNYFIAFDVFLKNDTGSPLVDNLYLDNTTAITMDSVDASEEMNGLVNSLRMGFLKIGSTSKKSPVETIQGLTCNNNCDAVIFEPYSTVHTDLSIERALKYDVNLVDGEAFPSYACIKSGGPIYVKDAVSGSPNLNPEYFALQHTITEKDFATPLFQIPDGITKVRVYVWIEGQDIDSLETDSEGAELSLNIDFVKDTSGYTNSR